MTDLISRQAVLSLAKDVILEGGAKHRCVDATEIKLLPSAQPQQTGHWILKRISPAKLYGENLKEYECSECYRGIRCTESQLVNYPYCHCGAKMVEPQESEDKKKLSWLGKRCEDCGNKKCKELGELPKGYDCALWQAEREV